MCLGRMVGDERQGWAIFAAMGVLFLAGVTDLLLVRSAWQPCLCRLRRRFGAERAAGRRQYGRQGGPLRLIFNSALFATITTDASCGAVNSMHDSFTALGGFVPLFNIQLGEIIVGGVGAGLYGMLALRSSRCSSPA